MLRYFFATVMLLHGLIHLMRAAKAFRLADISALTSAFSKGEGIIWMVTAVLLLITLLNFILRNDTWWIWALPAIVFSQVLIVRAWHDAKAGTIANILILAVVVIAFADWKFNRYVNNNIRQMFQENGSTSKEVVTVDMLQPLPKPVKNWLINSGIVGKEKVCTVYIKQKGWMRTNPGKDKWIRTTAEQFFTADKPGFVWKVQMEMMPFVPVVGEDRYVNGKGRMRIKALSLFDVVNDSGEKIDQGTLQRFLAEICWFPSAALSPYITWESIDDTSARAIMHYNGVTGDVRFHFNNLGDLTGCSTNRFMGGAENATLEKWLVTVKEYGVKNGIRMPVKSEVTWKLKSGDYTWYKVEIADIQYNMCQQAFDLPA